MYGTLIGFIWVGMSIVRFYDNGFEDVTGLINVAIANVWFAASWGAGKRL